MNRVFLTLGIALVTGAVTAAGPEEGAYGPGQAIADRMREVADADFAFMPGGSLKAVAGKAILASYLEDKDEKLAVVTLTGAQVRAALERSVALVPMANPSFLQVSGLLVRFQTSSATGRLVDVETGRGPIDPRATYTVAMPLTLAKGGYGYFTVWDDESKVKPLGATLEECVKGLEYQESEPRYKTVSGT